MINNHLIETEIFDNDDSQNDNIEDDSEVKDIENIDISTTFIYTLKKARYNRSLRIFCIIPIT